MKRGASPVRMAIGLSVASTLVIFLLYVSVAGMTTASLQPGSLKGHSETAMLEGVVVGRPEGNAAGAGLRFTLRDVHGSATVQVLYRGLVPGRFKVGQQVFLRGRLGHAGVFVAIPDSLVAKCPSKYGPPAKGPV